MILTYPCHNYSSLCDQGAQIWCRTCCARLSMVNRPLIPSSLIGECLVVHLMWQGYNFHLDQSKCRKLLQYRQKVSQRRSYCISGSMKYPLRHHHHLWSCQVERRPYNGNQQLVFDWILIVGQDSILERLGHQVTISWYNYILWDDKGR